ncbi:hypothetical protein [Candidatus Amarolinea dominans]|uniref:hypothetical protein n=1 Tax=Candidatus Amarolinea dominans TaxID=3140696 RepID=UPI001DB86D88|nr:hypothetical protein [Anaerolineae bacterium]
MVAGSVGLSQAWPISLAITALLLIVALSYYQTIHGYPSGGGLTWWRRKTWVPLPGLLAASALLVDYILICRRQPDRRPGSDAPPRPLCGRIGCPQALLILAVITLVNLRRARETGSLMTIPVYLFLLCYFPMLAFWRLACDQRRACLTGRHRPAGPATADLAPAARVRRHRCDLR